MLQKAHNQGIQVVAYDRLIMNSEYVDYYATFDNFKVGVQQASYIEEKLGLKDGKGPFNIELFGGSPTTTTPTSSMTAPCPCFSRTSIPASSSCAADKPRWSKSPRCVGTGLPLRPAWITC
ncbi:hypothetical protein HMSSN139_54310 [Paenibacillus sp. HMSSN-139]|nr:hypothetical protein HMSSN139_54310 [Paenibacillus sp. HMSSN-139]